MSSVEAPPAKSRTAPISLKPEQKLASNGHASQRSKNTQSVNWVKILQVGANGIPGILSVNDNAGEPLLPYDHQRQAVKKGAGQINFLVLAHGCGTGKTATFFQLFAAIEILVKGGAKCIVSVEKGTLSQWEETAHDWLKLRDVKNAILVTNEQKKVTSQAIKDARVLILSAGTLTAIFKTCFAKTEDARRNERGQPVKGWVRKRTATGGVVPLHPLFMQKYDLFGIDEAHRCRNEHTALCEAHYRMSHGTTDEATDVTYGGCTKRVALTATPIIHDVSNLIGLCKAIDAHPCFKTLLFWCKDKQGKSVRPEAVAQFRGHMDRVTDAVLDIPELESHYSGFSAGLSPEGASEYNRMLLDSQTIRAQLDRKDGKDFELIKLMGKLESMQQQLVSPHLARVGAEQCKKSPGEIIHAAATETGALRALREKLSELHSQGHARVIVACNHVMPMRVAMEYMRRRSVDSGPNWELLFYDGSLTLKRRKAEQKAFFNAKNAILFLSIQAGGTGLHLVPERGSSKERYCRAIVFWGSRPFSPQQVWQATKRIHRIGQVYKTEAHHLICDGSVDYGINQVHQDKKGLADAIVDGEWASCGEDGSWRKAGRIVDNCRAMKSDGSNFEDAVATACIAARFAAAHGGAWQSANPCMAASTSCGSGDLGFFRAPLASCRSALSASVATAPLASVPSTGGKREYEEMQAANAANAAGRLFKLPMLSMGSRPVVTTFSAAPPSIAQAQPMPFGIAAMQTSKSLSATALGKQAESFGGGGGAQMNFTM